ncbi:MAG: proline dehydrogenase family protein [Planctomycetaceae bacterium]
MAPQSPASDRSDIDAAVAIARRLLLRSQELQTPEEQRQQAELDRMIQHPDDKATLVQWTDQAFRTETPARIADQLTHILDVQGVPRFFSPLDRALLRGFQSFGGYLPGVAVPMVKGKMRQETANVILPAEEELLSEHLRTRQREGIRMNVNFLGESLLGETEAKNRLELYSRALRNPDIECISVKISTLYSQISSLAYDHTISVLCDRMERLYRTAMHQRFQRGDGSTTSKFVYLDMEEYRDMRLTADVLMRTLDREGLADVRAGIALQAYLPDSYAMLERLIDWSGQRSMSGCRPITIRVVKGANLEMERVDAAIGGWPQAPFTTKLETDANYKRMLKRLLDSDASDGIRIGIASHNLFDIALAMLWADRADALERVQFEMLEGMANHQRRAVFEATRSMLLYAPACKREDFLHAIGYLIRRLDENTGPSNFLRHTFRLSPDSDEWRKLASDFAVSYQRMSTVSGEPRRQQNRQLAVDAPPAANHWSAYVNEPDTDWTLPQNAAWAEQLLERWHDRCGENAASVPLVIGGREIDVDQRPIGKSYDPSRPGVIACRFAMATQFDVEQAARCAKDDPAKWRERSFEERHFILRGAAQLMRTRRGDLIGAAVAEGGKTVKEADPEVSEAIDFTEFYPLTVKRFLDAGDPSSTGIQCTGRGAVVVVSPWNFPIAIPCGGVAAALAAGNSVILKPSGDTVLPAYLICQCFWDAGVPREALQFTPCESTEVASRLVSHDAIDAVVLTGGTATAKSILRAKPTIHLIAETGGKNATIVTAISDREQAIKHVVQSAFGHSGQKCSATSLLLLEQEVYEDEEFRIMLADAVRSLRVGSAWDLSTHVGPLIRAPQGDLVRGLKELEGEQSWLEIPEQVGENPCLYRPGIRWNVAPGSDAHRTEFFGPVLSVIPFRKLDDAIRIANATGYGLTSGLESLDDREQELWRNSIRAGNLYINRGTTGAIVLRQPFGGMGLSSYGPGLKAGGPNYVIPLMRFTERLPSASQPTPTVLDDSQMTEHEPMAALLELARSAVLAGEIDAAALSRLTIAVGAMEAAVQREYLQWHDTVGVLGQDNFRRYQPVLHLRVRLQASDRADDVMIAAAAAILVKCRAVFSYDPEASCVAAGMLHRLTASWAGRIEMVAETDAELVQAIEGGCVDRLRTLDESQPLDARVYRACTDRFVPIVRQRVVANGYIEPLWFLQEQSLSHDYHRYGNLGRRG